MKIQVYEKNKEEEQVLRLRLFSDENEVRLCAVNEKGDLIPGGNLLSIEDCGKLYLCSSINRQLGLELDERGKLKI